MQSIYVYKIEIFISTSPYSESISEKISSHSTSSQISSRSTPILCHKIVISLLRKRGGLVSSHESLGHRSSMAAIMVDMRASSVVSRVSYHLLSVERSTVSSAICVNSAERHRGFIDSWRRISMRNSDEAQMYHFSSYDQR